MNRIINITGATLLGSFLLAYGCATIMTGTSKDISITSNPTGARIEIASTDGKPVLTGTTPSSVKLRKKDEYIVKINLEGYKEVTVAISHKFNSWVFGNILIGGIPGLIIDYITGAMNDLEPGVISIGLEMVHNIKSGESDIYAVLKTLDDEDNLRFKIVKMIEKGN